MTVLKHHYFLNFTKHGMEPPTWINIMREPISWFESRFWFKRNGWVHKVGPRLHENQMASEVCFLNFANKFRKKVKKNNLFEQNTEKYEKITNLQKFYKIFTNVLQFTRITTKFS